MNEKAKEALGKVKAAMAEFESACMDSYDVTGDVTNESEGMEGMETQSKMQSGDDKKKMIIAMMKKTSKSEY